MRDRASTPGNVLTVILACGALLTTPAPGLAESDAKLAKPSPTIRTGRPAGPAKVAPEEAAVRSAPRRHRVRRNRYSIRRHIEKMEPSAWLRRFGKIEVRARPAQKPPSPAGDEPGD